MNRPAPAPPSPAPSTAPVYPSMANFQRLVEATKKDGSNAIAENALHEAEEAVLNAELCPGCYARGLRSKIVPVYGGTALECQECQAEYSPAS